MKNSFKYIGMFILFLFCFYFGINNVNAEGYKVCKYANFTDQAISELFPSRDIETSETLPKFHVTIYEDSNENTYSVINVDAQYVDNIYEDILAYDENFLTAEVLESIENDEIAQYLQNAALKLPNEFSLEESCPTQLTIGKYGMLGGNIVDDIINGINGDEFPIGEVLGNITAAKYTVLEMFSVPISVVPIPIPIFVPITMPPHILTLIFYHQTSLFTLYDEEIVEDGTLAPPLEETTCENIFDNDFGDLLQTILNYIRFLVPIIFVILSVLDFVKALSAHDDSEMKKASKKFITRLIIALAIFLIPTIIYYLMDFIGANICADVQ